MRAIQHLVLCIWVPTPSTYLENNSVIGLESLPPGTVSGESVERCCRGAG